MNRFGTDSLTTRFPSIMDDHNAYLALQKDRVDDTSKKRHSWSLQKKKEDWAGSPLFRIPWHFFSLQNTISPQPLCDRLCIN